MNSKKNNTRYFISVVIDYLILMGIAYTTSLLLPDRNNPTFFVALFVILFLYMIQDKILRNKSIGKLILSIRIVPFYKGQRLSIINVVIRRLLEWMYIYKIIFWKLYIDIDKISSSKIEKVDNSNQKRLINENHINRQEYIFYHDRLLMNARIKALLIDFLIISWAFLLLIFNNIPKVTSYFNDIIENLSLSLNLSISLIILLYWAFKDLLFQNGSYGKHILGIEIIDLEGNLPSKFSLIIKNIVSLGFTPIELILFLLNRRGLGELLTYTAIRKTRK